MLTSSSNRWRQAAITASSAIDNIRALPLTPVLQTLPSCFCTPLQQSRVPCLLCLVSSRVWLLHMSALVQQAHARYGTSSSSVWVPGRWHQYPHVQLHRLTLLHVACIIAYKMWCCCCYATGSNCTALATNFPALSVAQQPEACMPMLTFSQCSLSNSCFSSSQAGTTSALHHESTTVGTCGVASQVDSPTCSSWSAVAACSMVLTLSNERYVRCEKPANNAQGG